MAEVTNGKGLINVADTILELHKWLHITGIDLKDQHTFIDAYCTKLQEVGLPVHRFFCGATVLHPLVHARAWKWIDGEQITDFTFTRAEMATRSFHGPPKPSDSPLIQLIKGAPCVRVKSTDEVIPDDMDWMLKDSYIELYGLASPNTGAASSASLSDKGQNTGRLEGAFTWSTKAKDGFSDDHIAVIDGTLLSLATVLRFHIQEYTSKTLLMLYLGEDAGSRVHRGEIERGEGLTIRSVIWFSDIRGFTAMSGELSRLELLELVNGVMEVTADVIRKYKGQTLKFMGDGLMAIFSPVGSSFQRSSFSEHERREFDKEAVCMCRRARLAAEEVQKRLAVLKVEREQKGLRGASVGVGLHYGDVSYGNVGAPERLDFTVLGPHVNLAARTEGLCSKLGAKVLCTSDFYDLDGDADVWSSRGAHKVKGVVDPVQIYELNSTRAG